MTVRPRRIASLPAALATALLLTAPPMPAAEESATVEPAPVWMVVHGGAGTIRKEEMSPAREAAYRQTLSQALAGGHRVLAGGGSALDAVEAAIRLLEDSPLFNAGRGAVFTAEGRNEHDAAIMDGATLRAGAVAAVTSVRNPIAAARVVMEHTEHVLLVGTGAEEFARRLGLESAEPEYFWTEERWRQLEESRSATARSPAGPAGTVGAVALDRQGRLAAGTSTGGRTGKLPGRVGDTPIIGAGTYADRDCAVSATGHGEYFMRLVTAHELCALVRYRGLSLTVAARRVIEEQIGGAGGTGGVIALDSQGRHAMVFNTEGMYRGFVGADGGPRVAIYRDQQ